MSRNPMWCQHCKADVTAVRPTASPTRFRCSQCDNEFGLEPVTVPPGAWDAWQIDEDLREARRIITDHRKSKPGLPWQLVGAGHESIASSTDAGPGVLAPIEQPPATEASSAATHRIIRWDYGDSSQPRRVAAKPTSTVMVGGWTPILFGLFGLIGGFLAMCVGQMWPEYFLTVLIAVLGSGVLLALHLGQKRAQQGW